MAYNKLLFQRTWGLLTGSTWLAYFTKT